MALQSSHCRFWTTNSIITDFCKTAPATSFCTSTRSFTLREWISVHIKFASLNFKYLSLQSCFTCFRHKLRSSGDSGTNGYQGGLRIRLHSLQCLRVSFWGIPSAMSTRDFRHWIHVMEGLTGIYTPQRQHLTD